MGSCVSSHKHASQDSALKMQLSMGIPPSPVKDSKPTIADVALKSRWSPSRSVSPLPDSGSKEEFFFDSQAWLESDCEDDFVSVNGDFTPSRGNTPVHRSVYIGTPRVNKLLPDGVTPGSNREPIPSEKKKKLAELFRESIGGDQDFYERSALGRQNIGSDKQAILNDGPKSATGTPYVSGNNSVCSSERTPNGDAIAEKEKSIRSVHCCLPGLVTCRSFSERKKMSPAVAANDASTAI